MKGIVITLSTFLAVVVAVLVGFVAYFMGDRSSSTAAPATSAAPPSATPATVAPSADVTKAAPTPKASVKTVYVVPKTQAPAVVTLASLGSRPCTTLFNRGVGYDRMTWYFAELGFPASMDVDHDGYPCETVYGNVN